MKIDIHVHTRQTKSGDALTRNIETEKFADIIKNTDVKIIAITNHNYFDKNQFEEFRDSVANVCQLWPGIELDITENGKRAHLLVISNPKNYIQFNEKVSSILKGKSADTFTISIKETIEAFDKLDCIYIAHYLVKKPDLGEEEIGLLMDLVSNTKRVIKEATNSISAGIYISHGHNSIYGSDVHDWDHYTSLSSKLPELRLPVESFEQFCLLLEKDEPTINTLLHKKTRENIEIAPFNNLAEMVKLDIYNDINVLFGSKGTGKTEILRGLSKYFNGRGHKTKVYESNDVHIDDVYDLKGSRLKIAASELNVDDCVDEIQFLKIITEHEVTSLIKYQQHFSVQERNKISQKLRIKSITKEDEHQSQRKLQEITAILTEFRRFETYVQVTEEIGNYVEPDLIKELQKVTAGIIEQLNLHTETKFFESKTVKLLNHIIDTINEEIAKKTGQPPKPTKTGFAEYASNRIKIELAAKKLLNNINKSIAPTKEHVGSLGIKGELYCKTNFAIHNGYLSDSSYNPIRNAKKTPQRDFSRCIDSIFKHIYSNDLFEKISELNQVEGIETINSVSDLLLFCRHFTLDGNAYKPSNGESSMILLYKELKENKDIYLIDEPEKSLGNDYISDVIVPLLREKALLGKKVIVATHDANIAVRTLPYNSIYRLHDKGQHYTLTGNPFSNSLKCIYGSVPALDWKEISMKTLEGGKEAFGERGKIYGN